jgi:RHS repeat-associated protein
VIGQSSTVTGVKFLLYDGQGSTRQLVNLDGTLSDSYAYDGYGVMLGDSTSPDPAASAMTNLLYTGEQYDAQLSQYYLRARYYNQNNGTFNRVDPYVGNMQDPQSLHKYLYVHNNPVNAIDPTGEFAIVRVAVGVSIGMIIIGAIWGTIGRIKKRAPVFDGVSPNTDPPIARSYLVLYSDDLEDLFVKPAEKRKQAIENDSDFIKGLDKVIVLHVSTVDDVINALNSNENIAHISYIGHGGPGVLYFSYRRGRQYNLSEKGGSIAEAASGSHPITDLPTHNVLGNAQIYLDACHSAQSAEETHSIAQSFANHFNADVRGVVPGVGFDEKGAYLRYWRMLQSFGTWKWVKPSNGGN